MKLLRAVAALLILSVSTVYADEFNAGKMSIVDGGEALKIGNQRILYFPQHPAFAFSSVFLGNGGLDLEHTTGQEARYNLGLGPRALRKIRRGSYNVAGGFEALENCIDCVGNSAWGEAAGIFNVAGNGNTLNGLKAGMGVKGVGLGDNNVFNGTYSALNAASTSVTHNTTNGAYTLAGVGFVGQYNDVSGAYSGFGCTSCSFNLYGGALSGYSIDEGTNNIVLNAWGSPDAPGVRGGNNNVLIGSVRNLAPDTSNSVIVADGGGNWRFAATPSGTTLKVASGTVILPTSTTTLVGHDTADTLTNKTLGGRLVKGVYVLGSSAVQTCTNSTSFAALAKVPVAANDMGANGRLRITTIWSHVRPERDGLDALLRAVADLWNDKTGGVKVSFGGTTFAEADTNIDLLRTEIANRNDAGSQVGASGRAVVTSTINTAATQDVVIGGSVASGSDQTCLESYLVELIAA